MRIVAKSVYYCDYCSRHGLSRAAMEKHEAGCTMNPERVCRWRIDGHSDGSRLIAVSPLARELAARAAEPTLLAQADIDWLRDAVDGYPACMLAALRQSGVADYHYGSHATVIFDYAVEVERLRTEERDAERRDAW